MQVLYSDPILGQIFMEVPYHFLNGEIGGNKRVRVNRALIKGILFANFTSAFYLFASHA